MYAQRSSVKDLIEQVGWDRLIQLTCTRLGNFTLTKLLWVRENEPEKLEARSFSVMLPKITSAFGSRRESIYVADASGTLMLDVANRQWSASVAAVEMDPHIGLRCMNRPSLWTGFRHWRGATGLGFGTPVVAGGRDQSAGSVEWESSRRAQSAPPSEHREWYCFQRTYRARSSKAVCTPSAMRVPGRWHVMALTQAAGLSTALVSRQLHNLS